MRVLGISGSLRRASHNTQLLRRVGELLPPSAELDVYAGLKAIPPYDADDDNHEHPHGVVAHLRKSITDADAILIATPEYNGSIPGVLKNAVDWASRPAGQSVLRYKPVAVIGASTGQFGGVWAQAELRKVLGIIGARVIGRELPVARADSAFDEAGRLVDPHLEQELSEILTDLVYEADLSLAAA
ncbi:MAG TPA: NADPH-dependent FMN reductase [Solirubrobacterales bacterium]|nr:NADPH-dependent FMN reductase [Solirubrobacterales bacterium]